MSERPTLQPTDQTEAPSARHVDDAARAAMLGFVRALARAAAREIFAQQERAAGGAVDDAGG